LHPGDFALDFSAKLTRAITPGEKMIRAVIFDIGGVIVRTEDLEPRRRWERRFGLPDWGLAQIVFEGPVAVAASLGHAGLDAVWEVVRQRLNLGAGELAQLREEFWAGDRYDHALLGYIRSLRPRYRTGIISNAWPGTRAFHQPHINGETFDTVLYSAEEGLAKPDPAIYRRCLERLRVTPEEAVFVDDVLENVEAARALGMAGVHFRAGRDVPAEFEKLGIL
jgi:putative hydrolase of the HAD superfamily